MYVQVWIGISWWCLTYVDCLSTRLSMMFSMAFSYPLRQRFSSSDTAVVLNQTDQSLIVISGPTCWLGTWILCSDVGYCTTYILFATCVYVYIYIWLIIYVHICTCLCTNTDTYIYKYIYIYLIPYDGMTCIMPFLMFFIETGSCQLER